MRVATILSQCERGDIIMKLKKQFQKQPHIHIYDLPSVINRLRLGCAWIYYSECRICGKLRIRE